MNIEIMFSNKSLYDYCKYDELQEGNQVHYDTSILSNPNITNSNIGTLGPLVSNNPYLNTPFIHTVTNNKIFWFNNSNKQYNLDIDDINRIISYSKSLQQEAQQVVSKYQNNSSVSSVLQNIQNTSSQITNQINTLENDLSNEKNALSNSNTFSLTDFQNTRNQLLNDKKQLEQLDNTLKNQMDNIKGVLSQNKQRLQNELNNIIYNAKSKVFKFQQVSETWYSNSVNTNIAQAGTNLNNEYNIIQENLKVYNNSLSQVQALANNITDNVVTQANSILNPILKTLNDNYNTYQDYNKVLSQAVTTAKNEALALITKYNNIIDGFSNSTFTYSEKALNDLLNKYFITSGSGATSITSSTNAAVTDTIQNTTPLFSIITNTINSIKNLLPNITKTVNSIGYFYQKDINSTVSQIENELKNTQPTIDNIKSQENTLSIIIKDYSAGEADQTDGNQFLSEVKGFHTVTNPYPNNSVLTNLVNSINSTVNKYNSYLNNLKTLLTEENQIMYNGENYGVNNEDLPYKYIKFTANQPSANGNGTYSAMVNGENVVGTIQNSTDSNGDNSEFIYNNTTYKISNGDYYFTTSGDNVVNLFLRNGYISFTGQPYTHDIFWPIHLQIVTILTEINQLPKPNYDLYNTEVNNIGQANNILGTVPNPLNDVENKFPQNQTVTQDTNAVNNDISNIQNLENQLQNMVNSNPENTSGLQNLENQLTNAINQYNNDLNNYNSAVKKAEENSTVYHNKTFNNETFIINNNKWFYQFYDCTLNNCSFIIGDVSQQYINQNINFTDNFNYVVSQFMSISYFGFSPYVYMTNCTLTNCTSGFDKTATNNTKNNVGYFIYLLMDTCNTNNINTFLSNFNAVFSQSNTYGPPSYIGVNPSIVINNDQSGTPIQLNNIMDPKTTNLFIFGHLYTYDTQISSYMGAWSVSCFFTSLQSVATLNPPEVALPQYAALGNATLNNQTISQWSAPQITIYDNVVFNNCNLGYYNSNNEYSSQANPILKYIENAKVVFTNSTFNPGPNITWAYPTGLLNKIDFLFNSKFDSTSLNNYISVYGSGIQGIMNVKNLIDSVPENKLINNFYPTDNPLYDATNNVNADITNVNNILNQLKSYMTSGNSTPAEIENLENQLKTAQQQYQTDFNIYKKDSTLYGNPKFIWPDKTWYYILNDSQGLNTTDVSVINCMVMQNGNNLWTNVFTEFTLYIAIAGCEFPQTGGNTIWTLVEYPGIFSLEQIQNYILWDNYSWNNYKTTYSNYLDQMGNPTPVLIGNNWIPEQYRKTMVPAAWDSQYEQ